jgi:hypothetical protein
MENYNRIVKDIITYKYTVDYVTNYYLDDKLHRIDGPAKEWNDGTKCWFQNGKRHRIDGPAIEYPDGEKHWYQNGLLHRLDGPALEYSGGDKEWYYEDEYIDCKSQEEFERLIKLKLFW